MLMFNALRPAVGMALLALAASAPSALACAGDPPDQGSAQQRPPHGPPPQAAIDACAKLADGASCSFTGRRGEAITGSCHAPPQQSSLACIPAHPPMPKQQAPQGDDEGPSHGY